MKAFDSHTRNWLVIFFRFVPQEGVGPHLSTPSTYYGARQKIPPLLPDVYAWAFTNLTIRGGVSSTWILFRTSSSQKPIPNPATSTRPTAFSECNGRDFYPYHHNLRLCTAWRTVDWLIIEFNALSSVSAFVCHVVQGDSVSGSCGVAASSFSALHSLERDRVFSGLFLYRLNINVHVYELFV